MLHEALEEPTGLVSKPSGAEADGHAVLHGADGLHLLPAGALSGLLGCVTVTSPAGRQTNRQTGRQG